MFSFFEWYNTKHIPTWPNFNDSAYSSVLIETANENLFIKMSDVNALVKHFCEEKLETLFQPTFMLGVKHKSNQLKKRIIYKKLFLWNRSRILLEDIIFNGGELKIRSINENLSKIEKNSKFQINGVTRTVVISVT